MRNKGEHSNKQWLINLFLSRVSCHLSQKEITFFKKSFNVAVLWGAIGLKNNYLSKTCSNLACLYYERVSAITIWNEFVNSGPYLEGKYYITKPSHCYHDPLTVNFAQNTGLNECRHRQGCCQVMSEGYFYCNIRKLTLLFITKVNGALNSFCCHEKG